MSAAAVRGVVRRLGPPADPPPDADLVTAFAGRHDHAAFAELVRRHGPTVLGVCRRVLGDAHDAEDAFQAVFLVLARKANTVRPAGAVGGWLYGVAVRTANKAKVAAARRRRREMNVLASRERERPEGSSEFAELRAVLDAELARLPEAVRAAVVLCDLHGKTRAEAAAELGCPEGTVAARVHRGRKKLADALTRRGLALPATGITAVLTPVAVSAGLSQSAVAVVSGTASAAVLALAREVIRGMTTSTFKLGVLTLVAGGLFALTVSGGFSSPGPAAPSAEPPPANAPVVRPAPDPNPDPLPGHVSHIEFAPGGKRYFVVAGGQVRVHDTAGGKPRFTVAGEAARYSADGKSLFVMGEKVRECDPDTGKAIKEFPRPKPKYGWHLVGFAPDGKQYAAHFGFFAGVYDTASGFEPVRLGKQIDSMPGSLVGVTGRALTFSPNGKRVLACGVLVEQGVMGLAVWNAETGDRLGDTRGPFADGPRAATFSPDGETIAIGFKDNVWLFDPLKETKKLADTPGPVTALTYSRDGKMLAVGFRKPILHGADKPPTIAGHKTEVQVLDAETGKQLKRFDGFEGSLPVSALAFSPDGTMLVAGTGFLPLEVLPKDAPKAGEVKTFSLEDAAEPRAAGPWRETKVLDQTGWLAGSTAYSPDGKVLYVGGSEGRVRAYDVATWKQLWDTDVGGKFAAVAVAPDGKTLAATVKDGVKLLDAATGKVGDTLEEKGTEPLAVGFFPDAPVLDKDTGQLVATRRQVVFGSARGYFVKSWLKWPQVATITSNSVAAGKQPADEYAVPLAVDPAGKRVVVTGPIERSTGKNILWAWGAGTGASNEMLTFKQAAATVAAWSETLIVIGDADGGVAIVDATTFQEKSRLQLAARVVAVAVSADGKHVAAAVVRPVPGVGQGAYAEEVFVWPADTPPDAPEPISTHKAGAPFSGLASLAFAPDGKSLASAFCNFVHLSRLGELRGTVRVFALDPAKPEPESVAFAPDGKTLAVGGGGGPGDRAD